MTTKKITSGMFFPKEPRGNYECVTSVPRELIDDKGRALVKGLSDLFSGDENGIPAGSDILVKVLNSDETRLLHRRLFTVVWSGRVWKTGTDLRGVDVSAYVFDYEFEAIGDWWSPSEVAEVEKVSIPKPDNETYVPGEGHIVFNRSGGPKKPKWDVIVDNEVWTTVDRLPDETPAEHEARAKSIAAGSIMKPLEAVA
jgi:hypothetical protein